MEVTMKGYKWNSEERVWEVSEGWRSWGVVTALSSYLITLAVMLWYAIVGLIAALPFIVIAIVVGFVTYLIASAFK
jgi:hypothetical protein